MKYSTPTHSNTNLPCRSYVCSVSAGSSVLLRPHISHAPRLRTSACRTIVLWRNQIHLAAAELGRRSPLSHLRTVARRVPRSVAK
jgi:hypothetical protein